MIDFYRAIQTADAIGHNAVSLTDTGAGIRLYSHKEGHVWALQVRCPFRPVRGRDFLVTTALLHVERASALSAMPATRR